MLFTMISGRSRPHAGQPVKPPDDKPGRPEPPPAELPPDQTPVHEPEIEPPHDTPPPKPIGEIDGREG